MSTQTEQFPPLPVNGTHHAADKSGAPRVSDKRNNNDRETRIVGAALGGAILGASLGGPLGALVVGGLGAAVASQAK